MKEYEYKTIQLDKVSGSVSIPEEAIGVTTNHYGDCAVVEFLIPVDQ